MTYSQKRINFSFHSSNFLYRTEGGGKKTPLSGIILLDNIILGRAGMAQTLIKWGFEGM